MVPQVLFGNILAVCCGAECLTREPTTQHIKSATNISTVQFCNIGVTVNIHAFVHPTILFALRKDSPCIRHDFYSSDTLVPKQLSTIYATSDPSKKVEFPYNFPAPFAWRDQTTMIPNL
jgi:hypothetical protein